MVVLIVPHATHQQAYIFLGGDNANGGLTHRGRNNYFHELLVNDGFGGFSIQFLIKGDDATECRFGIGVVGSFVGLQQGLAQRYTTGIGMFDNDTGRRSVKLLDTFQCGIGITDIVIG